MTLESIVQDVIGQLEEASGKSVLVTPDPSIKVLAKLRIARGAAPAHVLSYNPAAGGNLHYVLCYQCGMTLRAYQTPEAERFDVAATWRGRKDAEKVVNEQLRQSGHSGLNKDDRASIRDQMYDGLILQLRSVPVGLRVDDWITHRYPELAEQQRAMTLRQLQENAEALGPQVKKISPAKMFAANASMNAAFAMYWSRNWSDPLTATPYRVAGHADAGEALLRLFDETSAEPASDRSLIESWGMQLGLNGWFEIVPFQNA